MIIFVSIIIQHILNDTNTLYTMRVLLSPARFMWKIHHLLYTECSDKDMPMKIKTAFMLTLTTGLTHFDVCEWNS